MGQFGDKVDPWTARERFDALVKNTVCGKGLDYLAVESGIRKGKGNGIHGHDKH